MDMKHKNLFLAACAIMALAACSDNLADSPPVVTPPAVTEPEEKPILFGLTSSGATRADFTGAEAAEMLGKTFVVSGYKGSSTGTVGSIVFDNYVVNYYENSAHTTASNQTPLQPNRWTIPRSRLRQWEQSSCRPHHRTKSFSRRRRRGCAYAHSCAAGHR